MTRPFEIVLATPSMLVGTADRVAFLRSEAPHRILSFAPHGGGFANGKTVAIAGFRNEELPEHLDPLPLLRDRLAVVGGADVALMTSRSLAKVDVGAASFDGEGAAALATVGLSNAVAIGDSPGPLRGWGTINVVVRVDVPVVDVALVELVSIVAEARTVAVLEAGIGSRRSERTASGTGTDCIAVMAPLGDAPRRYAGKHTAIGCAVGVAVHDAVSAGIARWRDEVLR